MTYADYSYYLGAVSGGPMDEVKFNRLIRDASRIMDMQTTGIDNVHKLRLAYPVKEEDAEAVKMCACRLVAFLGDVEMEESALASGQKPSAVSAVSSGAESMSYDTSNAYTAAQRVAGGSAGKNAVCRNIVKEYLSGVTDANGVNLLYMGRYPRVF